MVCAGGLVPIFPWCSSAYLPANIPTFTRAMCSCVSAPALVVCSGSEPSLIL